MRLTRYFVAGVVVAMASGCASPQVDALHNAQSTLGQSVRSSSSNLCPANPNGSGILVDGDFSQATDPGGDLLEYAKPTAFAPGWKVEKRTIDLYGSTDWDMDGLDGYCSIDLDGYKSGGIASSAFPTKKGTLYYVTFLFSGNGGTYGQPVKQLEVKAAGEEQQMQWDTSNGNDAEHGKYQVATWNFTARGSTTVLGFTSLDYAQSRSGPVIAAVSVSATPPAMMRR